MDAPDAPTPPNPYAVASAQTSSNVTVAIANSWLGNADVDTPDGSTRFVLSGSVKLYEPVRDSNGNSVGTNVYSIPRFKQVTTLSAKNQQIKTAADAVKLAMNQLAEQQTKGIDARLSTSFSISDAPARGSAPAKPALITTAPTQGAIVSSVGEQGEVERNAALTAINERLQWQIDQDKAARILKLECQGIFPGSEAYSREMLIFDRQSTDARTQAFLAASKELETRTNIDIARGRFNNEAQQQDFQQRILMIDVPNQALLKNFQVLMQLAAFLDTQRQQFVQEKVLLRAQPVNELSSLLSGGRIEMPQFAGFRPGHIADTPVGQYAYQSAAMEQQRWNVQVQNQQQLMGGLLSLGGSLAATAFTGGATGSGLLGGMR